MKATQNKTKALGSLVLPSHFIDYRDWLLALYDAAQKTTPISWLDLAHDLGLSRTNALFLVARGKRPLSGKAAQRLASSLELGPKESWWLKTLVEWQNCRDFQKREVLFQKILEFRKEASQDDATKLRLEYFSAWWHPALRERIMHRPLVNDPDKIAKMMQPTLRPEQVSRSLELLQSLGLIRLHKRLWTSATDENISTGAEVDTLTESLGIIRYHRDVMTLAKDSLTHVDESQRDISAVTFCVSKDTAEKIKEEIASLRARLLALAADENQRLTKNAEPFIVWQFNAQLFPLTRSETSKAPLESTDSELDEQGKTQDDSEDDVQNTMKKPGLTA
jgi:uncharacterized protein (TIGR02147 family)